MLSKCLKKPVKLRKSRNESYDFTEKKNLWVWTLVKQSKQTEREQKIQELTVWQDNCFHLQIWPIDLEGIYFAKKQTFSTKHWKFVTSVEMTLSRPMFVKV